MGDLSLFLKQTFLVHNLYIYLTCFCVRWPPAFFKGRVLRDFLSCSLALFWSRKLLPSHIREHWEQTQRPNSCHLAGTETHTHMHRHKCSVIPTNSQHTHTEQKAHSLQMRLWDKLSRAVAWVFFTQTHTKLSHPCVSQQVKGCWIFLSHPCMRKQSTSSAPRGGHMADKNRGGGRARDEQIKKKKQQRDSSWIKFYDWIVLSVRTPVCHTEKNKKQKTNKHITLLSFQLVQYIYTCNMVHKFCLHLLEGDKI